MKKILIILLAIAFNVFAQGEGDRIVNPTWKLSSGVLSPTVSTWTLTLPATTFSPSIVTPLIIGGADTISTLTYKTTTGVGKTGARHIFQVGTNGATEAMTILNNGFVGIGMTAPSRLLHLFSSTGEASIKLQSSYVANDQTAIEFYDKNASRNVYLNNRTSTISADPIFQIVAGGTTGIDFSTASGNLRIAVTGNVGIGTVTPLHKLSGYSTTATNLNAFNFVNNTINKVTSTVAQAIDTSSFSLNFSSLGSPKLSLKGKTGNSMIYVDSVGVGIGIASPNGRLVVKGSGTGTTKNFIFTNSADVEKFSIQDDGAVGVASINNLSASFFVGNTGNIYLRGSTGIFLQTADVNINSGQLFVKQSTGDLGLGTTTPLHKLSGYSTTATNLNAFNFVNNTINKVTSTVAQAIDTSSYSLNFSSLGSPKLSLKGKTGNSMLYVDSVGVGIGTASPSDLLEVNNAIRLTGTSSYVASQSRLYNTASGLQITGSTGINIADGSGNQKIQITQSGKIALNASADGGYVGIGTATPYAQYSQVGATPIWYATDSDVNLHRTSLATATDTSAIKIDASVTEPVITVKNAIGNGFTLQSVAAGGASFDGGLTIAGKLIQANQSAIAGTITSDYSVIYPYDDGSNVKVMALLDDAGTETTAQVLTGNMWGEPSGGAILNGTSQYYSHVDNANLDFGVNSNTISFWLKMPYLPATSGGAIITKGVFTSGGLYTVRTNGSNEFVYTESVAGTEVFTQVVIQNVPTTEMHQIMIVRDVVNGYIYGYLDGVLNKSTVYSSANNTDNTASLTLSSNAGGWLNYRSFTIYGIKLHNYALTQAEVTKRWNNGQPHLFVEPYATKGASQTDITNISALGSGWANPSGTNLVATNPIGQYIRATITSAIALEKVTEINFTVASNSGSFVLSPQSGGEWTVLSGTTGISTTGTYTVVFRSKTATKIDIFPAVANNEINMTINYVKRQGETFSIANTDWGASGAVCTIGGTKSIANSTAYPIAVSGKYDARKTIAANYEFTGTAKVGSILKYVKITNTIADPDTISLGTTALGTQVLNLQIIGASSTVIANVDKWFSDSATQTLFLSGVNWAADNLEVVLIYEPIGEKL
uniref:Putative tail protein n=2 Tax=viral metagenome TaxID=1070528 RepID=A0A6M3K5H1_9ZZZZ